MNFLTRFNNLPKVEGMTIGIAQYAKNKCAVSFSSNGYIKSDLCQQFCLFLNNGDFWANEAYRAYSNREVAYIVPISKVEKFLRSRK